MESPSVLIVGGGLAGLSAALFLSWRGVPAMVVERHAASSPHPRAVGFTPRTLELLRATGLGSRVPQVPPGSRLRRARVHSLAGEWFEESSWTPPSADEPGAERRIEHSPCTGAALAQDRLEPILRDRAVELGADVRFGTELVSFHQDGDGVTAVLRSAGGAEHSVRSRYLIAADGNRSPVREALGIGRDGRGLLSTSRSVLFKAPLEEYLQAGVRQFEIDQPGLQAFLTTYGDGRWVLMFADDEDRDLGTLETQVLQAIGRTDLEIELVTTGRWELSALIADRFADGRVFLAGDAAHTLPPSRGGYGANTGIDDVHNLAWKLASVLSGESAPSLLDTYDAERRPIAWLRHQQIFARADYRRHAGPAAADTPIIDDDAMEFGQLYRSDAVLAAGAELPPAARPEQWAGRPGTRAPHLWLTRDGARLSTLDLFQRGWVLLAAGDHWAAAAGQAAERTGIAVDHQRIGGPLQPDEPAELLRAFGLSQDGATLVRPDGYVAWRSPDLPLRPADELTAALAQVSFATRHAAATT
ncbi:FAD-dependent monooxygenase [Nonomuraea zeae]|uniref:FAD-binding protein n=1 Tax=Nonomuraea zeae TaxID=1642303 RepID=A0A5S4G947_9ACTN|nr:FAD-dependent monooxygenase [Nonomuraea zeae]TMR29054.1 FAD-binding protein [Nonomuraea zeae]